MTSIPSVGGTPTQQPSETNGDSRRAILAGLGGLAAGVLATTGRAAAGPLDPPAGPVISTGKTLNQIETRTALPLPNGSLTLAQPGTYYLTRDLTDVEIQVIASNVVLDLNGFTLTSTAGNITPIVAFSMGLRNVIIRNGYVRSLVSSGGIDGVTFGGPGSSPNADCVAEDLVISGYGRAQIDGSSSHPADRLTIRRCLLRPAASTGSFGVITGPNAVIEDCAIGGGYAGVSLGTGSTVRRCSFTNLAIGSQFAAPCLFQDVLFSSAGIAMTQLSGEGSRIERAAIFNAAGAAMNLTGHAAVSDCTIDTVASSPTFGAGIGISATNRLRLERCQISRCASDGVRVSSFDTTARDCSITENAGIGIDCIGPAQIERCHFANNNGGIRVDQLARIAHCHLDFNAAFGIRATATASGIGGVDVADCTITRHATGVVLSSPSGSAVRRCMFFANDTAITSAAGNFVLLALGAAAANTATNPNVNIGV